MGLDGEKKPVKTLFGVIFIRRSRALHSFNLSEERSLHFALQKTFLKQKMISTFNYGGYLFNV